MNLQEAQAVVAVAPNRVEFQRVRVPEPGLEDVVVRVRHSWISPGTEGSFVRGERIAGDTPRSNADPLPFPHVPGYQKVGVVEWVGSAVQGIEIGETVFATISQVEEMFYPYGGHVSPAVTHHSQICKLPVKVSPLAASSLVLAQVGYNVGMRPQLRAGDAAIVIGDGLVGHWSAQTLKHRGARVMLVGKHDERLDLFPATADDRLVNTTHEDAVAVVRDWAPRGVQVVADTVGSITALESFYAVLRRGAHLVSAGFYGPQGLINIQKMRDLELTLHAPSGWTSERLSATLELLSCGVLQTEPLITHRFPAQQAAEAFEMILSRREPFLGVVLDWE
jgi:2-desacetyl-2-hydroxyethyl bacteriochlorophyllide A dehydrogenase